MGPHDVGCFTLCCVERLSADGFGLLILGQFRFIEGIRPRIFNSAKIAPILCHVLYCVAVHFHLLCHKLFADAAVGGSPVSCYSLFFCPPQSVPAVQRDTSDYPGQTQEHRNLQVHRPWPQRIPGYAGSFPPYSWYDNTCDSEICQRTTHLSCPPSHSDLGSVTYCQISPMIITFPY